MTQTFPNTPWDWNTVDAATVRPPNDSWSVYSEGIEKHPVDPWMCTCHWHPLAKSLGVGNDHGVAVGTTHP